MAVTIIAKLGQHNSGTFALVNDTDLYGGLRGVADNTERDDIPTDHRKAGMVVYTEDSATFWVLGAGLDDSDWFPIISNVESGGLDITNTYETIARFHDNGIRFNNRVGGWISDGAPKPFRWMSASIGFASADYTLGSGGATEIGAIAIICTGTMGAPRSLILPDEAEAWYCVDAQQVTHDVTAKISGGTGVTIPAGYVAWVRHDGYDYVLATLINSSSGGSGLPGGSTGEVQWNSAGTLAGASGFKIISSIPTFTSGFNLAYSTFKTTVSIGITTGDHTWSLPDATDTAVGKATTDTFTNKTFSLSGTGNVLTDSSITQYDLIMANATPAFKRFAKGSNNTVLGVSSGGVVQYATVTVAQGGTGLTAMPGSDTYVLFNDGGAYGADSGMVYDKTNDVLTVTGAYVVGSTVSSNGSIRGNATVTFKSRNNANGANVCVAARMSGNDEVVIGGNGSHGEQCTTVTVEGSASVIQRIDTQTRLTVNSSSLLMQVPIVGSGTAYGSVNSTAAQAMADANQTATAGVYAFTMIKTTGALTADRTLTLPSVSADSVGYGKWIYNACTGAFNVLIKPTGGSTVTVPNGKKAFVWIDNTNGITLMYVEP